MLQYQRYINEKNKNKKYNNRVFIQLKQNIPIENVV